MNSQFREPPEGWTAVYNQELDQQYRQRPQGEVIFDAHGNPQVVIDRPSDEHLEIAHREILTPQQATAMGVVYDYAKAGVQVVGGIVYSGVKEAVKTGVTYAAGGAMALGGAAAVNAYREYNGYPGYYRPPRRTFIDPWDV